MTWIQALVALQEVGLSALQAGLFFTGRAGFIFPWASTIPATCLWILLGAATIAAWLIQWRAKRQIRSAS